MGTDTGDFGSSRCFSTGRGVGERSVEVCLYPTCFSCAAAGAEVGVGVGGRVTLRESMPLRRSFEKSEGRFVSVGAAARGEPSGTLVGGSGNGDDGAFVGVTGRGDGEMVLTRLSATSVSSTAVGMPGVFSAENFSCRYRASVRSLCWEIERHAGCAEYEGELTALLNQELGAQSWCTPRKACG